jgi:alkylation response protein AidB-like acyl-CoA dehydrogenase
MDAQMQYGDSADGAQLRATARGFLTRTATEAEARRLMATDAGYDEAFWRRMASQLGWQGLAIPERYGGAGYGWAEMSIVLEEMGRALLCAPFLSSVVLAATALIESGDEDAQARYLPDIVSGDLVATVTISGQDGAPEGADIAAVRGGDGWVLSGDAPFVLDGHVAGLVLVPARGNGAVSLFAVDAGASGVCRTPLDAMDQTRKLASLSFDGTPARLVGASGDGSRVLSRVLDRAAVALAAEQVGGAARCLDMAVEYAKTRVQFGRPIGSFQAVKHKCADMLVAVETARSALFLAIRHATTDHAGLPVSASTAKALCSEAYLHVATENIHVHGGIGFTWEHAAHLYFRRAKSGEMLLGTPTYHRRRFARLWQLVP